jgi:ADP-ribosylglycohydrolase
MKTANTTIIGAIAGDVIGSVYEWDNVRSVDFPMLSHKCTFTDDTVLTVAVADALLNKKDFSRTIWNYARQYPHRGYGGRFAEWINYTDLKPYNSFGNGSAMRVSAVGFAFDNLEEVLEISKQSAEVTHNHPEGIKGAQAIAASIFLAKKGNTKLYIKDYVTQTFGYKLDDKIDEIRKHYLFDETCQGSVPQAIIAFLESNDYESAIRLAISIGGDSDTIACMTGGIAAAFYKTIPQEIIDFVRLKLPSEFLSVINSFDNKFSKTL